MARTSTLDVIRFNENGERLSWKVVQMGSSTRDAPFEVNGHFAEGEEIWCSRLVYSDGVTLLSVERPPQYGRDGEHLPPDRGPTFLLYPSEEAVRKAGWRD